MSEVAASPLAAGAPAPAAAAPPAPAPAAAPLELGAAATPGQRLKAARERRGLSSQKAADQMHLDLWVIEALESDQFDKIGPSVYVKGHLKRYAGMLGLPAAEIMAAYGAPAATSTSQRGGLRMRTQEPVGIELPWATIAAAAIAAVAISGIVWLRPWRAPSPAAAAPPVAEQSAPPATTIAGTADVPIDAEQDNVLTAAGAAAAAATTAAVGTAAPASAAPASAVAASRAPATMAAASTAAAATLGGGKAQLRLSFSADSWVEIHDAAGQTVFAGNGRANSVKTVGGDAPLRVYLRSASGVQLAVNNHVVAIGPQFVAGDMARFEAGADGVLRRDTHSARPHG